MVPVSYKMLSWVFPAKKQNILDIVLGISSNIDHFTVNTSPLSDGYYNLCLEHSFPEFTSYPQSYRPIIKNSFFSLYKMEEKSFSFTAFEKEEISHYLQNLNTKRHETLQNEILLLNNIQLRTQKLENTSRIANSILGLHLHDTYVEDIHFANLFAYRLTLAIDFSFGLELWEKLMNDLIFTADNVQTIYSFINEEKKYSTPLHLKYLQEKEDYFFYFIKSKSACENLSNKVLPQTKNSDKKVHKV